MCKVISLYGLDEARGSDYTCAFAWPDDCNVQAGGRGIVLSQGGKYTTAFFEAFPIDPRTFIRGEGATVPDAERQCWDLYQRILACPNHEYERRDYENGVGICKHCGMTGFNVILGHPCRICSAPTWYTKDSDGGFYCEAHAREKPISDWTDSDWDAAYLHDRLETEEIAYRRDSQDIETHLHIDGIEVRAGGTASTGTFYHHPYALSTVNGIWSLTVRDKDSDTVLFQADRDYRDARIVPSINGFLRAFFLQFRDDVMNRTETAR